MPFQTIPCTSRAQPLVSPGDPPTLLFNNDLLNTIYIGDNLGITGGSAETGQIPPLGYVQVDGTALSAAIWGVCKTGQTAQLLLMPGCANAQASPAQIAAQISALGLATATNQTTQIGHENSIDNSTFAASNFLGGVNPGALTAVPGKSIAQDMLHAQSGTTTEIAALIATGQAGGTPGGVPLLNQFSSLISSGPSSLAGNASVTVGGVSSNQPGTEGLILLTNNGAGAATAVPVGVFIQWDDGAGNITDVDGFWAYAAASTSTAPSIIGFRTPTKALHCSVVIVNKIGRAHV